MKLEKILELKNRIKTAQIISFDLFDTLLFRLVSDPKDIFTIMENKFSIKNFRRIRTEGQFAASQEVEELYGYPHANLDEIYHYIGRAQSTKQDWNKIKQAELDIEYDALRANYEMQEIFRFAVQENKKIIIVSDMYIDGITLKNILNNAGYNNFAKLYVSGDIRKTKYKGDLYEHVIDSEGVNPGDILHIGDNYKDDYKNAISHGMQAFYYQGKKIRECKSLTESIHYAILKNISYSFPNMDFWERLGCKIAGSLYMGLLLWLIEAAKDKKICFLSRDGYNLFNIFKRLKLNDCEYIYTSRRALLLAGTSNLNNQDLQEFPPYTYGQNIGYILEYLNIDGINEQDLKKAGFEDRNSVINNKNDIYKLKQVFKANKSLVLKTCETERRFMEQYFTTTSLCKDNNIIFDCGWNGSSQYLLERALKKSFNFAYTGIFDNAKSRRQLDKKKFCSYLFGLEFGSEIAKSAKRSVVLYELFFGAPHSSVLRYDQNGPVFENIEEKFDYKKQIFNGIWTYVKTGYYFIEKYNIEWKCDDAVQPIERLIYRPTQEEAVNIGNLENVDGFVALKKEKKYLAKLSLQDFIKNPRTEIYWDKGLIKRTDTDFLIKFYLSIKNIIKNDYKTYNRNLNIKRFIKRYMQRKMPLVCKFISIVKKDGIKEALDKSKKKLLGKKTEIMTGKDYQKWINKNETGPDVNSHLEYLPKISIVVPVYNVKETELDECINSVLQQKYTNWQLCLVDDYSSWKCVRSILEKYEEHPQIDVYYRKENGHISKATNDGIKLATGEFIAFLDCDDILAPNALYEIAKKLNENKLYDFIYSDEDKLSEDGTKRHSPFFKPDWSPDTFMSLMYTCHLGVYRTTLVRQIGGLRLGYEGAQDYDFTLRFTEMTENIGHIPKILYHWRERTESIASNPEAKPYALEAVKKAKEEALIRRNLTGKIEFVPDMFQYRVNYINKEKQLVSIIIPSKDNYKYLLRTIKSIKIITLYDNFEIIVVDNGSNEKNKKLYIEICEKYGCQYFYKKMSFNFSMMCNMGAKLAKGELLLFLNDDVKILQDDWLDRLAGQAALSHTGAVGAKLLYPDSSIIQHVGIINLKIGPSHSYIGYNDKNIYHYGLNRMDYNFLAVTGACLMVERVKFEHVNGFDEQFPIAYNDIDFCFSLNEAGWYNIVRNDVVLYHYESVSRGRDEYNEEKMKSLKEELSKLYNKHIEYEKYDPFYNVNLTEDYIDYSINLAKCNI